MRLLTVPPGDAHNDFDFKSVGGGLLVQTPDAHSLQPSDLKIVTARKPSAQQVNDLMFAWKVAKFVKSNAIVFAQDGMTLGIGAGQMSRVDSARIASIKAESAGLTLAGSAVASDAFFPFRDGLDVVVDAGASCVIQPGGSMRDDEVIAAANERGIAMVFTGVTAFSTLITVRRDHRAAAAGAAAPPTSSGTKVPTTAVLTTPARNRAKALFRSTAPALLRSSGDALKAAHLRQPLLSRHCLVRGVFSLLPAK